MPSANDNSRSDKRRIRDGFLKRWGEADYSVASDETLKKLAEARNASSRTANKFMTFASVGAFLYVLRIFEIADQLEVASFTLGDLPFGPFALAIASLFLSTVALIRIGDSRSFDRQLRLLCEERHATGCDLEYLIYPNESAWGTPFSVMANAASGGWIFGATRLAGLLLINLFLAFLIISPALIALDFLISQRFGDESGYTLFQVCAVSFFLLTNIITFCLVSALQFIDRE